MQFRIAAYVMLVPVAAFGCVLTGTAAIGQEGPSIRRSGS